MAEEKWSNHHISDNCVSWVVLFSSVSATCLNKNFLAVYQTVKYLNVLVMSQNVQLKPAVLCMKNIDTKPWYCTHGWREKGMTAQAESHKRIISISQESFLFVLDSLAYFLKKFILIVAMSTSPYIKARDFQTQSNHLKAERMRETYAVFSS